MQIKEITIVYLDHSQCSIPNQTLHYVVNFALKDLSFPRTKPLYVLFPSTGKQLYFDRNVFESFIRNEITPVELIKETEIDGIYRNLSECAGINGIFIDEGALWKLRGKTLYLIDDDLHVEANLDTNFKKIE